ncbi:hypothetical protein GH714_027257 [Hevea brasiliensis]|uniref:Retrotransposon gag domain-containing protein n=1 Tax=Hevea brasiliensis TaxID=3981 RepID=A0A6A6MLC1_HEVBR|nr:hypothetical protein GH714_027257 [Hevea brasiliensis]
MAKGLSMMREFEERFGQRQVELRKELEMSTNLAIQELKALLTGISLQNNELASGRGVVSSSHTKDQVSDQTWNRFPKLDFPLFNGEELEAWVVKAEYYFEVMHIPLVNRVKIAALYLEGKAVQWHQGYIKIKGVDAYTNWGEYVQGLRARFGLQIPVRMFKPQTLSEAYSLARLQEMTVAALKSKPTTKTTFTSVPNFTPKPVIHTQIPTAIATSAGLLPTPNTPKLTNPNTKYPGNLTSKEITEKREKAYVLGAMRNIHHTINEKKGRFMLCSYFVDEGEDEDEEFEEGMNVIPAKELQLSLNAIRGTQGVQTMCITVVVNSWRNSLELPNFANEIQLIIQEDSSLLRPSATLYSAALSSQIDWPELNQLLQQYADIFAEPKELPPKRPPYDHKIPLKDLSLLMSGHTNMQQCKKML